MTRVRSERQYRYETPSPQPSAESNVFTRCLQPSSLHRLEASLEPSIASSLLIPSTDEDRLMASEATIQIQSNGHTLHPADLGLPGPPLDALQGVRPQQHHQLPDRGLQVGRGQPVHDGEVQRDRLLEQDAGLLPPGTATASTPCTAGCRRWRPGRGGQLASCCRSASAATATRRTSASASSSTPAAATCRWSTSSRTTAATA